MQANGSCGKAVKIIMLSAFACVRRKTRRPRPRARVSIPRRWPRATARDYPVTFELVDVEVWAEAAPDPPPLEVCVEDEVEV